MINVPKQFLRVIRSTKNFILFIYFIFFLPLASLNHTLSPSRSMSLLFTFPRVMVIVYIFPNFPPFELWSKHPLRNFHAGYPLN